MKNEEERRRTKKNEEERRRGRRTKKNEEEGGCYEERRRTKNMFLKRFTYSGRRAMLNYSTEYFSFACIYSLALSLSLPLSLSLSLSLSLTHLDSPSRSHTQAHHTLPPSIQLSQAPTPDVYAVSSTFRLVHEITGTVMTTSGRTLPEWGFHQYEVVSSGDTATRANAWHFDSHVHPLLPKDNLSMDFDHNLTFWETFVEMHVSMFKRNNALAVSLFSFSFLSFLFLPILMMAMVVCLSVTMQTDIFRRLFRIL
jgi:hypothetical protein